ncbi:tRNA pseudouridine synthase-like 1 isoform X2 [Boleophthalmus pectinirostris]|uniref:tRNA pseudouridine synthase-like 1 isoform X2 n=1 Tax=Boleophthalmus pectinirostris TaxID=150288 RepID=UPI000A1C5DB4|nr:tRNA pseudouridine synthase-like 1 isoform X2 [Boleophthalmus pectinirostris]
MHNNLARYLIFFQYIGTKYSGVVKVPPHQLNKKGVQDHLEAAILRLRPEKRVSLYVSSRTDTGVHALSNSAHFDLQRKNKAPFTEEVLRDALNFHLQEQSIRITRAVRVSLAFHSRYQAQSRTYVYRVALAPDKSQIPLSESEICWNLCTTELDIDSMREAAAMMEGTHDFSSFRAINSDLPFKNPVKTMDQICIQPGSSFTSNHFHRHVPFWELTFRSKSFLYKQVRRMAGALVAVGKGSLSPLSLKKVLDAQDSRAYPQGLSAPAHGLFLTNVEYRDTDLHFTTSEEQNLSELSTNSNKVS